MTLLVLDIFLFFLFHSFPILSAFFVTDGTTRIYRNNFFLPPHAAVPGLEPTSVSRVAPDWDL